MSPGYERVTNLPLNHPVDATCLFCHASAVQPAAAGTANRFVGAPFLQPGVGCERCHGAGGSHVRDPRPETIINPARLTPEARDSVCMQCHLEGLSRIARPGHRVDDFRPGQRLADVLTVFVSATRDKQTPGAVSHVESLAASRCKQASGDRMTCTTCHDPHLTPAATERGEYYRERCLSCHATFANDHHSNERQCTLCHMPRLASPDVSHTAVTDHRILRAAASRPRRAGTGRDTTGAFWPDAGRPPGSRSRVRRNCAEGRRLWGSAGDGTARTLCRIVARRCRRAHAARLSSASARTGQRSRGPVPPCAEDRRLAAGRRGESGRDSGGAGRSWEALTLWQASFDLQPYVEEIGLNLALGQCLAGQEAKAAVTVDRLLQFNPDSTAGQALRQEIARKTHCAPPD